MVQNNLTHQEKIQLVSKDFLDRKGETFTSARTDGRLDWEKTLGEGGSYSEYILHPKTDEDLVKNAYRIASDMIVAMNTPFKVRVNITGRQSCTDSKELYVATNVFDDKELTVGQKLDTFIGTAVHEGCHLLYTDFNTGSPDKLIHTIQNIIEDERIERECGQHKPGLVNFLKATKYYNFDKYAKEVAKKGGFDNLNTFQKLLNAILSYIRYPKALNPADTNTFVDVLLSVREILTPYPANPAEVTSAAQKIAKVIKEFLKQKEQEKKNEQKNASNPPDLSGEKAESSESDGNSKDDNQQDSGEQNSTGSSNQSDKSEDKDEKDDAEKDQSADGDNKVSEDASSEQNNASEEVTDKEIEENIEKSMNEIQSALQEITSDPKQELDSDDKSGIVQQDGGKVGDFCEGTMERGMDRSTYIRKGTEDKIEYERCLQEVKRYIPAMSRVLKMQSTEYKLSLRGMRSGVLDTNKLAEAFQGVPTVYTREGEVKTDRVSICILVDESGSMYYDKEDAARKTAILLNEALGNLNNVDLYIYGHTSHSSATELYVYREKNFHPKHALGSTSARGGNHDSIAIKEVCARVRKHTKEKCLFFMISDGAPNEPTTAVKRAVEKVEKDNFSVVAISIDPYYDPSTMYKRNVRFTDLNTLATEVGKMVKKAIMDNTKKKINL